MSEDRSFDDVPFPYYDDKIVFSDNLPKILKERLDLLRGAWERKDLFDFIYYVDCLEPLMKNSYHLNKINKEELEKFFVMLGRDWWNRSPRVLAERERRKQGVLSSFPKP